MLHVCRGLGNDKPVNEIQVNPKGRTVPPSISVPLFQSKDENRSHCNIRPLRAVGAYCGRSYTLGMTESSRHSIRPSSYEAIVLDLDGVITRTAKVHAAAWKAMFDDFLSKHYAGGARVYPFSIDSDYRRYVDGKPRYDGVRSFLASRDITLPEGKPDDPPGERTVCGLGNRKNVLFLQKLESDGVEVYASTLSLIRGLRGYGYRVAVVSSSRNCLEVMDAAGITELFDARVDGEDLQRYQLKGKPAPDMFLEACRRLDCTPAWSVEDAVAGVEAASAAGFSCVIGVNRGDAEETLRRHGADIVVNDLSEIALSEDNSDLSQSWHLPSAFQRLEAFTPGAGEELALFLDYDGTLTPIVAHPNDAVLSDSMRHTLYRLSALCELAIISGRDLADVRKRVGIKGIWYAGSHGFDIEGPDAQHTQYQEGIEYLPQLDEAEQALHEQLDAIPGSLVERKRFAIAAHYRRVAEADTRRFKRLVEEIHYSFPGLTLSQGKKILELRPDIDWDKGKALQWMMRFLSIDPEQAVVAYIGDDTTDEDAFRAIAPSGIGVLVARSPHPTRASCRLDDSDAVERFLNRLADTLEAAPA